MRVRPETPVLAARRRRLAVGDVERRGRRRAPARRSARPNPGAGRRPARMPVDRHLHRRPAIRAPSAGRRRRRPRWPRSRSVIRASAGPPACVRLAAEQRHVADPRLARQVDAQHGDRLGRRPRDPAPAARNVRRSIAGAVSATPGTASTAASVRSERPRSVNAPTRRSAAPDEPGDRPVDGRLEARVDRERGDEDRDADRDAERGEEPCARVGRRGCARRRGRDRAWALVGGAYRPSWARRAMSGAAEWSSRRPSDDLLADQPVADHEHPVRIGGRLRVVRHEHDRLAAVHARPPQRVEDAEAGREVEVAGGLVGEQEGRAGHDRARDRDPLLLARGQLVGAMALLAVRARPA